MVMALPLLCFEDPHGSCLLAFLSALGHPARAHDTDDGAGLQVTASYLHRGSRLCGAVPHPILLQEVRKILDWKDRHRWDIHKRKLYYHIIVLCTMLFLQQLSLFSHTHKEYIFIIFFSKQKRNGYSVCIRFVFWRMSNYIWVPTLQG